MKTIEEFSKEVLSDEKLKKELLSLKPENVKDFLEKHDCGATFKEVKEFLIKKKSSGELSEEELDVVAGGVFWKDTTFFICENPNCKNYNLVGLMLEGDHSGEVRQCPVCGEWTLKG